MRVRTKLIIGFSVIALLVCGISLYATNNFGNLKNQFTVIEKEVIPATLAMNELEKVATDSYLETMKYILYDDTTAKEAALSHLNHLQEIETQFSPYSTTKTQEFESNQIMTGRIADLFASVGTLMDYKRRGAGYEELLAIDRTTGLPSLLALQQEIAKRKIYYIQELGLVRSDFNFVYSKGVQSILLAAVMGILLATLAATMTTRSIVQPLSALRKGTEMIAKGDLNYKVGTKANDEIGQLSRAFDNMTQSLSTSMTSIDNLNQEITERKQAEEALKESQKFNTGLLENSTHATMVINPDTSIRYVNPTWEKLSGWNMEEIKGVKAPYPWWPENMRDAFLEGFKEAMKQETGNGEVIAQKKNGENYWISMNWTSVLDEGEMQYLLINSIDITERKNMEEALKESEEKFSKAFRSSPNSISITTIEDGIFLDINDSFTRNSGYTREEVIGRSSKKLGIWAKPEERDRIINILKEKGQVVNEEYTTRIKSGETRTMLFSAEPINVDGKECLISVSVDITERKNAEQFQHDDNYVLTLLSQGAELNEILDAIIKMGEDRDVGIKGSVLLYDTSKGVLVPASAPSLPADYTALLKDGLPIGPNIGTCGTAAYRKKRVVVPDIENSPMFKPFAEAVERAKSNNLLACWSQPIFSSNGEVLGTIANYRNKVGKPSEDDLRVLEWSARIAAIAIERKRDEVALANEAIRRSILIEQSSDGIVVVDGKGKVYEANQRFAEMLGYTIEEVQNLGISDWEAEFPMEQVEEMIASIDENGDHFETKHVRKDGSVFDVEISTNGAVIAGQKLIFCVCRDISKRKEAEEALRQSEEKFSKAFLASPNSISISTLKDGKFIEVNDSFIRDKGYSREEIIGHTSEELGIFTVANQRFSITQALNKLNKKGRLHNELVEFRNKDGETRTGLLSAELITINNEPCMIVINTDITERKQAEEQLRLLGSVTQQVLDSTIVTDRNFNITYMNKAAENLVGYSFKEANGNNLASFDIEPLNEDLSREVLSTVSNGKVWSGTMTKQRKDGSTIICDSQLSPLYDENDQIIGFIDVERDVTKQKETEAKLQIHKLLIENILSNMPGGVLVIGNDDRVLLANEAFHKIFHVGKRTLKKQLLSNLLPINQLCKAYTSLKQGKKQNDSLEFRHNSKGLEKIITCNIIKMDGGRTLLTFTDISHEREEEEKLYLTDRLASIGEMAAGLAHELNNPLTGILALSQMLVNSDIPQEYREDLNCVYSEAVRAAEIVKNVLLFSRNNNYENGHASANEVIQSVLRLREYEEKVNNISVVTNFKDNLPDVAIDKFQLQQVFLNMVLNAEAAIIDTKKPGKLTVTTERSNGSANIIFSDTGCGIKKQVIARIFDPFFTTKDIGKGTGLGLSICYGIIVKNGGKITVKSEENEGTTFTIKMPIIS